MDEPDECRRKAVEQLQAAVMCGVACKRCMLLLGFREFVLASGHAYSDLHSRGVTLVRPPFRSSSRKSRIGTRELEPCCSDFVNA